MGIAPMSRRILPEPSTSVVDLWFPEKRKDRRKSFQGFLSCRANRVKGRKTLVGPPDGMAPEFPYQASGVRWFRKPKLGENGSEGRGERRGERCLHFLCDVGRYHMWGFFSMTPRIGLPVLKEHAVETRQPHAIAKRWNDQNTNSNIQTNLKIENGF